MSNIFTSIVTSMFIALLTTLIFYDVLGFVIRQINKKHLSPRFLLMILMSGIFTSHALSIFIYGIAYWILTSYSHYPPLGGVDVGGFGAYLYYSATTYSSLGIGDIYATGCMRIISGFEVINGLTLIAWSATFTYFAVEKMWCWDSQNKNKDFHL
jgi:hypothetical protein